MVLIYTGINEANKILEDEKAAKPNQSSVVVANGVEIYIVLEGLVDFDAEKKRLTKELDALKKDEAKFSCIVIKPIKASTNIYQCDAE